MDGIYIDQKLVTVFEQPNAKKPEDRGQSQEFYISKMPVTVAREIAYKYPVILSNRVQYYAESVDMMRKILKFVCVKLNDDRMQPLDSETMINNHVKNAEILLSLENEMLKYNFGFFKGGEISNS